MITNTYVVFASKCGIKDRSNQFQVQYISRIRTSNISNSDTKMSNKLVLYNLDVSPPVRAVRTVAKLLGLELELRYLIF